LPLEFIILSKKEQSIVKRGANMIRHINNSAIVCLLAIIAVGFAQFIPTANAQTPLKFGWSAVTPHTADYDGDGHLDMGLYDSTKGTMYARNISGTELAFDLTIALPGFIVACADFDGDGKADPASYDTASGFLCAYLSAQGYQLGALPCAVGLATTKAVPADYDGDSKADMALYDAASGIWIIYPSASGYQPVSFILGGNGATAVPMDYDGDGKADPCVYNQNTGLWMVFCSASQYALSGIVYGGPGCAAAPADFDGDSKADPTVYSAALGVWGTLLSSSNLLQIIITQGGPGCTPVPGKYYFTNQADYAVYNATNGCWYIDYSNVGGLWTKLGCTFLKALVKGAGEQTGKDIAGWSMGKIFHHNTNPSDPNWPQEQETLNEMNQKLDTLLTGQVAIQNQISNLSAQLSYDMSKMTLLIQGGKAEDACTKIRTHFDQNNTDSYRAFYQCDTNNPPPNSAVTKYAESVKGTWDIENHVSTLHDTIMPSSSDNGLLWDWAALATNSITPDNLLDNFSALANYYANLYMYQMKGVTMYADACRVMDTSTWSYAQTALYITNDVANMIQDEVYEFRQVTYTYVMTAVNSAYNPLGTNLPLIVTNEAETLASLEFFSRQWLGQTQSLCATFLAPNRPNEIGTFADVVAVRRDSGVVYTPVAITTNVMIGRPFGYWSDANCKTIMVDNAYCFICKDYGQVPMGLYDLRNLAGTVLCSVTVTNYSDDMQPSTDPSVTNWFGHGFAAAGYINEWIDLPLDIRANWESRLDHRHDGDMENTHFDHVYPTSLSNYNMSVQLTYNLKHHHNLPTKFDCWIGNYGGYPLTISNLCMTPVIMRVHLVVENSSTYIQQGADDVNVWQEWDCGENGGLAWVGSSSQDKWVWHPYTHDTSEGIVGKTYSYSAAYHEGMLSTPVSGVSTSLTFWVGGYLSPGMWCIRDAFGNINTYVSASTNFKLKRVICTFTK